MKQVWRSFIKVVDRHPAIVATVLILLLVVAFHYWSFSQGVLTYNRPGEIEEDFVYRRPVDFPLNAFAHFSYMDTYRVGLGIEVFYIRPFHGDILISLPLFQDINPDLIAFGVGVSTPIKQNLFVGVTVQRRLDEEMIYGIYGKLRF